jgi:hypothetical protein
MKNHVLPRQILDLIHLVMPIRAREVADNLERYGTRYGCKEVVATGPGFLEGHLARGLTAGTNASGNDIRAALLVDSPHAGYLQRIVFDDGWVDHRGPVSLLGQLGNGPEVVCRAPQDDKTNVAAVCASSAMGGAVVASKPEPRAAIAAKPPMSMARMNGPTSP